MKLLAKNALPHTKTGRHRRIKFADLMGYKPQRDQVSRDAISELATQAQKLEMGYE